MNKPVKSSDPRKASIVAALKAASGASKVTLVRQIAEDRYSGHCLRSRPGRGFESLGNFEVEINRETLPTKGRMTVEELHEVLAEHMLWIESGGKKGTRNPHSTTLRDEDEGQEL